MLGASCSATREGNQQADAWPHMTDRAHHLTNSSLTRTGFPQHRCWFLRAYVFLAKDSAKIANVGRVVGILSARETRASTWKSHGASASAADLQLVLRGFRVGDGARSIRSAGHRTGGRHRLSWRWRATFVRGDRRCRGRRTRSRWRRLRHHRLGRRNSCDVRSEAKFLQRGSIQFAGRVEPVIRLEFFRCRDGVRIPFAVRIAFIVAAARQRGLNLADTIRRRSRRQVHPGRVVPLARFLVVRVGRLRGRGRRRSGLPHACARSARKGQSYGTQCRCGNRPSLHALAALREFSHHNLDAKSARIAARHQATPLS